jgi:uncharacterized protein YjbJ (UPF0337 family)
MNADQLKRKWIRFKGELKQEWGKFTDEILERYGETRSEVMKWAEAWQQKTPDATKDSMCRQRTTNDTLLHFGLI